MNQNLYELSGAGESQADRILAHLQRRHGRWVAMPTLWKVSGAFAVHSRIADLRRRGLNIEQTSRRRRGQRTFLSFYRLHDEQHRTHP